MPARSKNQRKEILASLYHFCHFNIGKDGKWNGVKLPNYKVNISTELREAVATMGIDEWVELANRSVENYNKARKADNATDTEIIQGFEIETKPVQVQTAIDFDKERIADNLGELIIMARKVADALEKIAETAVLLGKCCGDFHGVGPGGLLVENYKFDVNVSQ